MLFVAVDARWVYEAAVVRICLFFISAADSTAVVFKSRKAST